MTVKPPYVIPSMEAIRAMDWNGRTVASLFAGGGGSSTGYRMAGFKVLYANEFIEAAANTYAANAGPHTIVDRRDVRRIAGEDILAQIGMEPGELDVLDGSPPCSAFSTAGKRSAGWGKAKAYSDDAVQVVDDLFFEYARILGVVRPKVFVAENVTGLVKGSAKGYFKAILAALRSQGYRVSAKVLDASWLGLPQARQRLIFIGVREDLAVEPSHPKPLPYQYRVRDVLPGLSVQGHANGFGVEGTRFSPTDRPSGTLGASPSTGNGACPPSMVGQVRVIHTTGGVQSNGDVTERPASTMTTTPQFFLTGEQPGDPGPLWKGDVPYCPETGKDLRTTRKPHPTTGLPRNLVMRYMTIPEARIISGFPADFILTGSYAQRWERLGRAVPPIMMRAVASHVEGILTCADSQVAR